MKRQKKNAKRKQSQVGKDQPVRASKRMRRMPGRFRDDVKEERHVVKLVSTGPTLRSLWKRIEVSRHKLCFVKRQLYGEQWAKWYLVQVNLDETDPM